jgi:spore coat polysaccharide biosynthesis protein SpsF
MQPIEVLIAIQARSNSTRFPKKIYEQIGNRRVLDHVIECAKSTSEHIMRFTKTQNVRCQVAVLHPKDDHELVRAFNSSGVMLISGDEEDVLSRYVQAQRMTDADYVVRLTSDCPLMLDFVIAKHVQVATRNALDYVSNVDESCRFVADGFDCEVLSRKALHWLEMNAVSESDREHVTTAIRRERPPQLKQGIVTMKIDSSKMKMSLDTPEDLEVMRAYFHEREHKMNVARRQFGSNVYEL